ncbi:MAG: sensor histidine kinase [Steroidobacteraceae bacterium]
MFANPFESADADDAPALSARARLGLVSLVAFLVCVYALLWNFSVVRYYSMGLTPVADIASPSARVLQHALLLPLLIATYYLATSAQAMHGGALRVLPRQLGALLAFVLLVRPLLVLAAEFTAQHAMHPLLACLEDDIDLNSWLSTALNYSLVYALGLFLLLGLIAFANYRQEQLRSEALRAHWLQAQLETLRVQLHPHFLFNTLNTISARVTAQPEEARTLISELAALLRDSIDGAQSEFYPLAREIELAEKYLRIISARFGKRFKSRLDVPRALEDRRVPHGLLLTLLENAVTHGISRVSGDCELSLRCAREEQLLVIEIRNPCRSEHAPSSARRGGLEALAARLAALYGTGFSLDSRGDGAGFWCARVTLPAVDVPVPYAARIPPSAVLSRQEPT